MIKPAFVFSLVIFVYFISTAAEAQHRHAHHRRPHTQALIVCNKLGCSDRSKTGSRAVTHAGRNAVATASAFDANGNVVGGRPAGCPYEFCGCEAARYVFGEMRPKLNLAANWIRKFPRAAPAPGMAAVRSHHVMVLMRHIDGNEWLVHDGNSGGHLTREHVRSIVGYVIVDPTGSRSASRTE